MALKLTKIDGGYRSTLALFGIFRMNRSKECLLFQKVYERKKERRRERKEMGKMKGKLSAKMGNKASIVTLPTVSVRQALGGYVG